MLQLIQAEPVPQVESSGDIVKGQRFGEADRATVYVKSEIAFITNKIFECILKNRKCLSSISKLRLTGCLSPLTKEKTRKRTKKRLLSLHEYVDVYEFCSQRKLLLWQKRTCAIIPSYDSPSKSREGVSSFVFLLVYKANVKKTFGSQRTNEHLVGIRNIAFVCFDFAPTTPHFQFHFTNRYRKRLFLSVFTGILEGLLTSSS